MSDLFRTAEWHERETAELFGIVFEGHPDPRRLLLPDDLEGFPLRKDFTHPNLHPASRGSLMDVQPSATVITPLQSSSGSDEFLLNVGPQHPATHGVLRVVVTMDGEVVKDLRAAHRLRSPRPGEALREPHLRADHPLHRPHRLPVGHREQLRLRHGRWRSSSGLEVPKKVEYIRVLMAELNRIASHLLWLAAYGLDMGAFTPFLYAFRDREEINAMIEEASGGRLTTNYFRVGGFVHDLPKAVLPAAEEVPRAVRARP